MLNWINDVFSGLENEAEEQKKFLAPLCTKGGRQAPLLRKSNIILSQAMFWLEVEDLVRLRCCNEFIKTEVEKWSILVVKYLRKNGMSKEFMGALTESPTSSLQMLTCLLNTQILICSQNGNMLFNVNHIEKGKYYNSSSNNTVNKHGCFYKVLYI